MQITASLTELVAAAQAADLVPSAVSDVTGAPGQVTAVVRVDELPGINTAVKMAARLAGPVGVTMTVELSGATLTVVIAAAARGFNVSEQVAPVLTGKLRRLPAGLATVRTADGHTLVDVDLDAVARLARVRVTAVTIGETVTVTAEPALRG